MKNNDVKRDRLIDYFRSGEKEDSSLKIGIEFEHFVVDSASLNTVSYYGVGGVQETLKELEKRGWEGYYNDEYLLGVEKKPCVVSTEPAAQFEISIDAQSDLPVLEEYYLDFMREVLPIFNGKGQELIAVGYQPVNRISELKLTPKKRYDYMFKYLEKTGTMAHNMMKGTCAVQVIIDYVSEADMVRKYRIGSALSPILYTIYDNAYVFEAEVSNIHNIRQHIWENTDKARSGLVKSAFDSDFSYGKYADYILENKLIFFDDEGELTSTGDSPFKDVFDPEKHGDEVIYHAISIVFPDLRLKKYLEFRMMDAVPYPLNFSAPALIKGLMYSDINLDCLEELFRGIDYDMVMEGKKSSSEEGMNGLYLGKTFKEWGLLLIDMATESLSEKEAGYLKPLKALIEKNLNPREIFKKIYDEKGIRAAIENSKIEVD